ncbi:hypothetical protein PN498_25375 [Oscillatoria sp. CS-180]|uniref:Asr1405/Asl0597 family protein n=1 Tax=Oscillatoria sp. CS-180 TaxID=3021720 RepID=UPI00232C9E18|nr:Asr1405/Asl0597 family protein [Oscillatoria sp. CS-180]MDB9529349.1 hypothetical protein [Oscillatoria sp. CS-180]
MEPSEADYLSSGNGLSIELDLDTTTRWDVYFHLQKFSVICECKFGHPLRVQVRNVTDAIHLWSAVQFLTAPKTILIQRLERCWQHKAVI